MHMLTSAFSVWNEDRKDPVSMPLWKCLSDHKNSISDSLTATLQYPYRGRLCVTVLVSFLNPKIQQAHPRYALISQMCKKWEWKQEFFYFYFLLFFTQLILSLSVRGAKRNTMSAYVERQCMRKKCAPSSSFIQFAVWSLCMTAAFPQHLRGEYFTGDFVFS